MNKRNGNGFGSRHHVKTESAPWNGLELPANVQRLALPNGRVLDDAFVWPRFLQTELDLDPDDLWSELAALPTWPDEEPIPFRANGGDPHWVSGAHRALNYRGRPVKRTKLWLQSGYEQGLRRYGYTGWQHAISFATHAVEAVPAVERMAARLNAGLAASGHVPHNHWIVTRYEDQDDSIGYHSDKDRDFAEGSYFIVIKFGAPRDFAFRLVGDARPFFVQPLSAGTAVFVRCKGPNAANDVVQHGVPPTSSAVSASGSVVSRCINTVVPWIDVARNVAARERRTSAMEQPGSSTARSFPFPPMSNSVQDRR